MSRRPAGGVCQRGVIRGLIREREIGRVGCPAGVSAGGGPSPRPRTGGSSSRRTCARRGGSPRAQPARRSRGRAWRAPRSRRGSGTRGRRPGRRLRGRESGRRGAGGVGSGERGSCVLSEQGANGGATREAIEALAWGRTPPSLPPRCRTEGRRRELRPRAPEPRERPAARGVRRRRPRGEARPEVWVEHLPEGSVEQRRPVREDVPEPAWDEPLLGEEAGDGREGVRDGAAGPADDREELADEEGAADGAAVVCFVERGGAGAAAGAAAARGGGAGVARGGSRRGLGGRRGA